MNGSGITDKPSITGDILLMRIGTDTTFRVAISMKRSRYLHPGDAPEMSDGPDRVSGCLPGSVAIEPGSGCRDALDFRYVRCHRS